MTTNPLLSAVFRDDLATLKELLSAGADVDALDRDGRSPLFQAITQGNAAIVNELLQAGTNVNLQDHEKRTPLHFTAIHFRPALAKTLLLAGAQVAATDVYGNTPLNNAVFYAKEREDMIKLLLEHGADPDARNNHEVSPRDLAVRMTGFDVTSLFTKDSKT